MARALLAFLLISFAAVDVAEAQRRGDRPSREEIRERMARHRVAPVPMLGVRGAYEFDTHEFGLGAQAELPLGRVLRFVPSGEIHFGDESYWQANADVAVSLLLLRAGGGLALVDGTRSGTADGDPQLGLNLFAGVQSPPRRGSWARPFAEARWTFLEEETPFRLVAGVNVPIRRTARR
jgi:hypothetical protein